MIEQIQKHYNLSSYEVTELSKFPPNHLKMAYEKIQKKPLYGNPFRLLIKMLQEDFKQAPVQPKAEPVVEPDWVKDYKNDQVDESSLEDLQKEQLALEKKIKSYKSAIEQAKKNYANNTQSNATDLRYIEQYLKDLNRAQRRYETLQNKLNQTAEPIQELSQKTETVIDIANGIAVFMDQGRLESLSKVISITTATQMRDKSLLNWLRRNFIYNHDDVNHQLALKVVNRYRAQFNLPPRTFEISNLNTDKQKNDKDIIDNKKDSMVVENKEVYEW